jgi:AcrR family transcriptional regulator
MLCAMAGTVPKPYHHGNLRAALLQRAIETVRERGAGELSLRELARATGVSHGAPRRHFPDRQALLDALALEGWDRLGGELRDALDGAGDGFDDRVAALARAYVRFATRDAALLELMFAGKRREGEDGAIHARADRAFETILGLIAAGQAAGELAADDPERVAIVMFATLQGLVSITNGGMLDPAQLDAGVTDAVERLLRGLRPRPG